MSEPSGREELRAKLAQLYETNRALIAGEVDAVILPDAAAPVLLRRAQEALRSSERLHRAIFTEALDAIVISNDAGVYVDANPAACELFGVTREELIGRSVTDFSEAAFDVEQSWNRFRDEGQQAGAFRLRRGDGTVLDLEYTARANFLPGYHLSFLRDVTQRSQAAKALRESEERYRLLFQAIPQAVLVIDARSHRVLAANDAACRQYGYALDELSALTTTDLELDEALSGHEPGSIRPREVPARQRRRDGTVFDAWITTHSLLFDAWPATLCVVSDITDMVRAQRDLRASEERFRGIVEAAAEGVWLLGSDDLTVYTNVRMASMLGYSPSEMIGRHLYEFLAPGVRADAQPVLGRRPGVRGGEQFDSTLRRKDGSTVAVSVSTSPVVGGRGEYRGVVAMVTDVTERRELEARLRQVQKLEGIGQFAGGIAHDFNNILGVIMGYAEATLRRINDPEAARPKVEAIQKAAERAAALTHQILAFSRKQVLVPKTLGLGDVVHELSSMLRRLIGEHIDLVSTCPPDLGNVCADPSQIEQVLLNLAANARDAMPQGGTLSITLDNVDVDERQSAGQVDLPPGPYVRLVVRDTGVGIPPQVQNRIFEPFFTTKTEGKGTGLGLATVYGIVKQSGGHIAIESAVGVGTAFIIHLPRTARPARPPATPGAAAPELPHGTETILFVEDEDILRQVAEEVLTTFGYRVILAGDPRQALAAHEQMTEPPALLITDLVMPGMSGRDLAERLVTAQPGLKVLFISGYASDSLFQYQIADRGHAFLRKPFTPAELGRKIREVLDTPSA